MGIVQLQVCKDVTRESGHPLDHANVWNTASLVFLCVKLTWAIPLSSTFCPCHLTIAHWLSICLFFSFFPVRVKCQQHAGFWWPPTDGLGKRLVNCQPCTQALGSWWPPTESLGKRLANCQQKSKTGNEAYMYVVIMEGHIWYNLNTVVRINYAPDISTQNCLPFESPQ